MKLNVKENNNIIKLYVSFSLHNDIWSCQSCTPKFSVAPNAFPSTAHNLYFIHLIFTSNLKLICHLKTVR